MTPTADPIDVWAREAHQLAGLNPRAYARRIVGFALIGALILHSVWIVSVVGALVFVGLAVWLQGWSLLVFSGVLVVTAGLWVNVLFSVWSQARGVALDQKNAPAMIELISQVATQLGAPKPTRVTLVPDFNAWVQIRQRARGEWHLSLGLPLLLAADVNQVKAVIGHELGHFVSGTPGARLVWAQQSGWLLTLQALGSSRLGGLVRSGFRTWGQRFQAESVAMARQHERSSDQAGAKVAGPRAAAEALIIFELHSRALSERFWPAIWKKARAGDPPENVFIELRHFLAALEREDVDRYYRSALAMPTLVFDVHPSLSDRIASLGEKPALPGRPAVSAAVALLGPELDTLSRELGAFWAREVKVEWALAGEEAKQLDELLEKNAKRAANELHPSVALDMARAYRRAGRLSEALPCYRRAAELDRSDAKTRLGLGLAMLETGDPNGLLELRQAVMLSEGDLNVVFDAFWGARRFLEARGEPQKNPFLNLYNRAQLNRGRKRALLEWGRMRVL